MARLPTDESHHRLPALGLAGAESPIVTLAPPPLLTTVDQDSTPAPFVDKYCPLVPPVIVTLLTAPRLVVPLTDNEPILNNPVLGT